MKKLIFIITIIFIFIFQSGYSNDVITDLINGVSLEVNGRSYFIKTSIILKSDNKNYNTIPLKLGNYQINNKFLKKRYNEFKKIHLTTSTNYFMFRGWQKLTADFIAPINANKIAGIEVGFHNNDKSSNDAFYIYLDNLIGYNQDDNGINICAFDKIDSVEISTEPKSAEKLLDKYNKKNGKIVIRNKNAEKKCLGVKLFKTVGVNKISIIFKK